MILNKIEGERMGKADRKRPPFSRVLFFCAAAAVLYLSGGCGKKEPDEPAETKEEFSVPWETDETGESKSEFARGSDISWAADEDREYSDRNGNRRKLYDICRNEYGMNAVRLRTWVDHPEGSCSEDAIIAYAKKCSNEGLRIMIDFHYSDDWADPQKQYAPRAWNVTEDVSHEEAMRVGEELYEYTYSFLQHMRREGVVPEWVQIGNEITYGMLWPLCSAENEENLAYVLNRGIEAVRDASPETKVVLHVSGAQRTERAVNWFSGAEAAGVTDYDVIGLSFYPTGRDPSEELRAVSDTLYQLNQKFCEGTPREIMMVEIGANYMEGASVKEKSQMICRVMELLKALPDGSGAGCLYWEIEEYEMEASAEYGTEIPNRVWEVFSPDAGDWEKLDERN